MDNFLATLLFAFVLVIGALALLGLGLLVTGKAKIFPGACGRAPKQKRDQGCGTRTTCELCKKSDKEDSDDEDVQQK